MAKGKIWLLLDSSKAGGIESHVYQLAEGLKQQAEDVEVVFLTDYGEHPLHDFLRDRDISYRMLNGRFIGLLHSLRRIRPEILHTHGYKAGVYGRAAAKLCNIRVVSTYHAGEVASGKLAMYDSLDRLTAGLADQCFAVSPQIAARLPCTAQVTNNFINTTNLTASIGSQIAFVGRVSEEKGPDYFANLASRLPTTNFHLYGDGPQLAELTDTCPANLHLHGQQDDMSAIWSRIGLLIMPSRYEGLPMAALEAMARGIPVLAYQVGALDKLIEPKVNGWLIQAGNLAELTKCTRLWLNMDEAEKQQFRNAAQNTIATKFASHIVVPELIANYRQVAN